MKDVLVVEDDQHTRAALKKFLTNEGLAARVADSAEAALMEIDRKSPDILISDWDLGSDMTGVHVVKHALACDPNMHVLMVSGKYLPGLQDETQDLDIKAYIRKPFSLKDIREALPLRSGDSV